MSDTKPQAVPKNALGSTLEKLGSIPKSLSMAMPFQNQRDAAGALSKAYITAFTLIALVSITVHFITSSITEIQQTSIRNSYYINQERALVEQISANSSKHFTTGEELDFDLMKQALENMEKNHDKINQSLQEHSILSPRSKILHKIYYQQPFLLDENVQAYIQQGRLYASFESVDQSEERTEAYKFLQRKARSLLQPILNKALADYQNEVISKIEFYHYMQLGCLLVILVVLLLEAAFIFHPLASKTRIYHNMLLKQALEDPLTGLANRRAFMNRAESEMKRTYRERKSMIVALTDLDHFKSVNDTYGHDVGDAVLKHFSNVLKKSLRSADIIGRIGGEEFAVVLPNTDLKTGKEVLERLCRDVENNPCPYISEKGSNELLTYTVSIGFTDVVLDSITNVDDLLKKSDEALYAAKEGGRNRAIYAEEAEAA